MTIERVPWSSATEAQSLAGAHIGVMPLTDDAWSRGKCAFKLLQYMAAALPCVASPVGANTEAVLDGVNGFHATDADEWERNLERLIVSPELRSAFGARGRSHVEERYSLRRLSRPAIWRCSAGSARHDLAAAALSRYASAHARMASHGGAFPAGPRIGSRRRCCWRRGCCAARPLPRPPPSLGRGICASVRPAAVFALATGLAGVLDLDVGAAAREAISSHMKWAVFSTLALLLLAVWRGAGNAHRSRPSWVFIILLLGAAAALAVTGYRGGRNVYEFGVGVKRIALLSGEAPPPADRAHPVDPYT